MATILSDEAAQQGRIAAQQERYRDIVQELHRRGLRVELEPLRLDALSTFMARLVADGRVTPLELEEAIVTYQVERLRQEALAHRNRKRG